jgi:hypothetical protein
MRWTMQGGLVSSGGGLPDMALRLNPARNGGVAGQMFVKPYAARGSRLELEPVRFTAGRDGATHIVTRLRLDGPMPDGVLRGLEIPVTAHWGPRGLAVNTACAPVRVSALKVGAVALGDARLTACPLDGGMITLREGRMGGGIALGATQLVGRMGRITDAAVRAVCALSDERRICAGGCGRAHGRDRRTDAAARRAARRTRARGRRRRLRERHRGQNRHRTPAGAGGRGALGLREGRAGAQRAYPRAR